jgi:hypothetical protein
MLAALALLCATAPVVAQNPQIQLSLQVPSVVVAHTGKLPISVSWRNLSPDRTIALRGEPGPSDTGGLEFVIVDARGIARSVAPYVGRISATDVATGDRRIELLPGHGHGISLRLRVGDLLPQPGRYRLGVRYTSPMPAPGNASMRPDLFEGVQAESDLIEIEVRP